MPTCNLCKKSYHLWYMVSVMENQVTKRYCKPCWKELNRKPLKGRA